MTKEEKKQIKTQKREEKKFAKLEQISARQSLNAEKEVLVEIKNHEKDIKKEEKSLKKEEKALQKETKAAEKAKAREEKEEIKTQLAKSNKRVFDWYKLDNAAKIFPAVSSVKDTNVFRLGVRLSEEVNPETLHAALVQTLERFPAFRVKLKRGMFWYFFEFNEKKPIVFKDDDCPCALIASENLNNYLFKTSYFQNRIYIDVFHSLSDGGGAIEFLKTLTLCYLKMSGKTVETGGLVKNPYAKASLSEHENSYVKYYDKHNKKVDMPPKAYKMTGTQYEYGFSVINAHISAEKMIKLAKSKNCTVTQYIVTSLLLAIYNIDFMGNPHNFNLPISVLVPVNLRKMFPSETLRNFSSIAHGSIKKGDPLDFESVLNSVKDSFEKTLTPDFMKMRFSSHTQIEKNFAIRIAPRVVKDIIMKAVYQTSGTANITTNFSNLGVVKLPESMEKYVEGFEFQSSVCKHGVTFCSAVTYRDDLCISFTRRIKEARLEKEFLRMLRKDGLEITLEANENGE